MRLAIAEIIAAILLVSTAAAARPHCTLRIHAEGNAHDSDVFSTQLQSRFTGRSVIIEKTPAISEQDVMAFFPYFVADGTYGVLLQLTDHGKLALDTLSVERRGTSLFVFLNGRPVSELQIDRRIADGKIYIRSGVTAADIELMRKDWRLIGQRRRR